MLMVGIVKKMQVRQRSSAWSTWATVTRDEKRRKCVLFKTMKHILRRALSLSFARWVSNVKQRTLMAAKASKVVSRWRHRASALCVVAWHLHTEGEAGKRKCMSKIIKRMLSRTIVQAFDSWKGSVQEIRRQLQVLSRVFIRLSLRTLAMSFDFWAVSVPAAIKERKQRDMAIKFDGVRSSLGIALKSLNESEAARSRLEGMVVSLSDELQQVQRDKENALKGSEKVLGVSRDKWRLSVSPQSASKSKTDSDGEMLEAKRQLVAVRAGLRTIRGEVKVLRRELHACASITDDSLMTHDSSFATQQGDQSQEIAMEREANARLAAELEHVRKQLEQALADHHQSPADTGGEQRTRQRVRERAPAPVDRRRCIRVRPRVLSGRHRQVFTGCPGEVQGSTCRRPTPSSGQPDAIKHGAFRQFRDIEHPCGGMFRAHAVAAHAVAAAHAIAAACRPPHACQPATSKARALASQYRTSPSTT